MEEFKEEWKPVVGYEGKYEVSNLGNVDSLNYHKTCVRKRIVLSESDNGYLRAALAKEGKTKHKLVHRIVARAFIPNPNNFPYINHKDENKKNNCVENLEWCDQKYNINYGTGLKRRAESQSQPVIQMSIDGVFIERFNSMSEAANKVGTDSYSISLVCKGVHKTSKGYRWRFEDDEKHEKSLQQRKELEKQAVENRKNYHKRRKITVLQFTEEGLFIAQHDSCADASKHTGFDKNMIRQVCLGQRESLHGYIFKYKRK